MSSWTSKSGRTRGISASRFGVSERADHRDPLAQDDDLVEERVVVLLRSQGDRVEPVDLALDRLDLGEIAGDHGVDQAGDQRSGVEEPEVAFVPELLLELGDRVRSGRRGS